MDDVVAENIAHNLERIADSLEEIVKKMK